MIFFCTECNLWIPHLNTSWVRSLTNSILIKRIVELINKHHLKTKDDLNESLKDNEIINFDQDKERRVSEYIQNLTYLGLLSKETEKFHLTSTGKKIAEIKQRQDWISWLTLILTHFSPSNKYTTPQYKDLRINYFLLVLELSNFIREKRLNFHWSLLGLCFTCRNKRDFDSLKKIINNNDSQDILCFYWKSSKEYRRVVLGVFKKWLEHSKLINSKGITEFGINIYNLYKDYVFIENSILMNHLYNENESYLEKEFEKISTILRDSTEEAKRITLSLLINKSSTLRTGAEWEEYVFNHLYQLGLNPKWYRGNFKIFKNIELSDDIKGSLTGGSNHNPDIIIEEPVILVDPKKDVNKEMHKVQAYDLYASTPGVEGSALICSKFLMQKKNSKMLRRLTRTKVIDKNALDLLVNNKNRLKIKDIISILSEKNNEGEYIDEEKLLDKIDYLIYYE